MPPEPLSPTERLEKDALLAGIVAAGTVRAVDVAAIMLIGFLVVPPLAILVFLVVVPLLVIALILRLLAAVISAPYLLSITCAGTMAATWLCWRIASAGPGELSSI